MRLGFLGLGTMGTPMALNLSHHFPLTVWNRSPSKYPPLLQPGSTAKPAATPLQLIHQSDLIFLMLFNEQAILSILTPDLIPHFRNKTLVNTSSVSVPFSQHLNTSITTAGGTFIEMPVSGSKIPAQQGRLVGMLAANNPSLADSIRPYIQPMTSAAIYCGPVGSGLKMKYAVNTFLITVTVGLAEAANLASAQGLDLDAFGQVLEAGPMASAYSKLKVDKILREDWSAQATIKDCYNSTQLITAAAEGAGAETLLTQLCGSLYKRAIESGLADEDMISVVKCLPKRGDEECCDKKGGFQG
ncbi:uncharacterized protein QC763_0105060 [Podospora pseudopauciseta]|uniref:Dehydrogenase n=1 Tax=Podospora pseudopauciseta TaxID=2093780 RepID=A0ABR0H0T1_9PEZI|nr:hypothetical protein QC763_0105060 [Podospora pseudopauciseta]